MVRGFGAIKTNFRTISAERASEVAFRDLGSTDVTTGALRHDLNVWFSASVSSLFPAFMVKKGIFTEMKEGLAK